MSKATASYASLPKQAPPQKAAPTQPLPPLPTRISPVWDERFVARPRSRTFSNIASWALSVQPGSPAPVSPQRRPSAYSPRRPSISPGSQRRLSVPSVRVSSASFLNLVDTPSTGQKAAYTPVVVDFPTSPRTAGLPSQSVKKDPVALFGIPVPPMPASPRKKGGRVLNRVRSWSVFGTRARSKSTSKPKPAAADAKLAAAAEIASRKKEGYKKKTRHARDRPLPLAAQLELAQLMDGGSLDRRIQAHMAERARAEGGLQRGEQAVGVGDVWRDGAGGIWLDQEEEWEYAHLLAGEVGAGGAVEPEWVDFEAGSPVDGEERRGSVSTQSSELSPSRLVQALEGLDDGMAIFGGSVPPVAPYKPGKFALSLPPARRSSSSDSVPRLDARPGSSGSARKRPAPLVLPLPSPTNKRPINSPINPEQVRRDFLENSFHPEVGRDSGTDSTPRNQRRGSLTVLPGYVNTAAASEEALSTLGNRKVLMKKSSLMNLFKTRKD